MLHLCEIRIIIITEVKNRPMEWLVDWLYPERINGVLSVAGWGQQNIGSQIVLRTGTMVNGLKVCKCKPKLKLGLGMMVLVMVWVPVMVG